MIDAKRTVGEIASDIPAATRIFERYGIDYCCGGKRTLVGVCAEHQLPVDRVVAELEAVQTPLRPRPRFEGLAELLDHIVSTHHAFTRTELGRLLVLAEKVERVHAARHPELAHVRELLKALDAKLRAHLQKEERELFPYLLALDQWTRRGGPRPKAPFGDTGASIGAMQHEHEAVAAILREMRSLTAEYVAPDDACESYRAFCTGLAALEADLHEHIHLENNVAFPAAEKVERETA